MIDQNKAKNFKKTHKKNTTLIISFSIFVGLLIFILIITSSIFLLAKYFNQKRADTLSNALKWQEALNNFTEEEPIVTVPNEALKAQKQDIGKINEVVSNEIIDLKINKIEKINLESIELQADFDFYKINLTIKNNTSQEQTISLFDFSCLDPNDNDFSLIIPPDSVGEIFTEEINLNPGQEQTGSLIFEINNHLKNINFLFNDNENTAIMITGALKP